MLRRGFTLLELLLVVAALGFIAQSYFHWKRGIAEEGIVQRTVDGFLQVDEAAYAFRIDNANTWPGIMGDLQPYLPGLYGITPSSTSAGANGVGGAYSISPLASSLNIRTAMLSEDQARAVARAFPNTGTFNPGTFVVTLNIPVPGLESSHDALVHRDGSREMWGDFDMDGFSVRNAEEAEVGLVRFQQDVAGGGSCATKDIGTGSDGSFFTCKNGVWTGAPGIPCNWTDWRSAKSSAIESGDHRSADHNVMVMKCEAGVITEVVHTTCAASNSYAGAWTICDY